MSTLINQRLAHLFEAVAISSYPDKDRLFPWQPGKHTNELAEVSLTVLHEIKQVGRNDKKFTTKEISSFFLKLWRVLLYNSHAREKLLEGVFESIPNGAYPFWKLEELKQEYHCHFFEHFLSLYYEVMRLLEDEERLCRDEYSDIFSNEKNTAELAFVENCIAENLIPRLERVSPISRGGWLTKYYEKEIGVQGKVHLFQKQTPQGEVRDLVVTFHSNRLCQTGSHKQVSCTFECAKVDTAHSGIIYSSEYYHITGSSMTLIEVLQFFDCLKRQ